MSVMKYLSLALVYNCAHIQCVSHCRGRISSLDVCIKDSEDQLRRLQSSRTDELQAFGPLMRSLKEALRDNQQRFRKMPKGPVGSYVRLKDLSRPASSTIN